MERVLKDHNNKISNDETIEKDESEVISKTEGKLEKNQ